MNYNITVLPGDGIGSEVTEAAVSVLKAVSSKHGFSIVFKNGLIGGASTDLYGQPLTEETVHMCKQSEAVLLGAVGGSKWDNLTAELRPEAGLLKIRGDLGLYANLRPAAVLPSLRSASPLKDEIIGSGFDLMIVRELTGGIYFGSRGRDPNSAYDTERYTKDEIIRIARTAFSLAEKRSGKLCSVDKANVLESSRLWREIVSETAAEYPSVMLSHMYIDNAAMQLIRDPHQFDVIVTSNMFGDILSDEASQITGSIGLLPSASLSGGSFGLYEPVHGSAPDIAGKNIANPIAAILSAAMLLRYSLNRMEAAKDIENAVDTVLKSGLRTFDIAGKDECYITCEEMRVAIINAIVNR